ncbi:hypothetical protein HPB47_027305 [Ixodes persulcatus]|uniref:Uncharacterized protein n=1 Tax=Ixodes persulcatus TaxID=34615 RepID=A0AC60PXN4_IXOPE|nr:hypothetical protein HPB47_027305 [Ixodes persulcatus]
MVEGACRKHLKDAVEDWAPPYMGAAGLQPTLHVPGWPSEDGRWPGTKRPHRGKEDTSRQLGPDQERRRRSQAGFLRKTKGKGPHKMIGAIDGCHVEILRPTESPNSYYNWSKFHSIVLQGICDDQNRFIDVYIGFPGSAHDARILKESPVFEDAEAKCAERDFFDDLNNARPPDQVTNDDDHAIQPDDATRSLSERIREAIAKTEC